MKSNGVQLDHFGFTVDINDVIEEKFTSTQTAQSLSSVSYLAINCQDRRTDASSLISPVVSLCNSLEYLTSLEFISCSDNVPVLFIDILHNIKRLKDLTFGALMVKKVTFDETF